MKKVSIAIILLLFVAANSMNAQRSADPAFDRMMNDLINFSVPLLTCQEYKKLVKTQEIILLDAREVYEYEVSHIANAKHIGYKVFNKKALAGVSKDAIIVVYSSVGETSEKIGEHLVKMGYKNVYNLYGGIFEWANQKNTLVTGGGSVTTKVHAFDKSQAQWLKSGDKVFR